MTPELRPYQADLMDRVRAHFRAGRRRVIAQAATGGGKGVMAGWMMAQAASRGLRVLFLAQRRNLVEQQAARLREFGLEPGVLMNGYPRSPMCRVQVASRDTVLSRSVRNCWHDPPPADLVIVDECHHLVSEYLKVMDFYPGAYVVGFSATPTREDGKGLGDYFDALECAAPTSWLVNNGYLVPVRCFHPEGMVKLKGERRGLAGDPVAHWRRLAAGRPTVAFSASKAASRALALKFAAAGIPAVHVDDRTPEGEREAAIAGLQDGTVKVLSNCMVYSEGTDVPVLSCCINLRKCGSYVSYAQMCGRVMRAHPTKVDAVLIDHSGACTEHGPPDEDAEWTLDPAQSIDERNREARKKDDRKKPITCPACGCVFSGSLACPGCNYQIPPKMLPPKLRADVLIEMDRSKPPEAQREGKVRYWKKCLATMAHTNRTAGAAAYMYKARFGSWPGDDGMPDVPAGQQWKRKAAELYPQYLRGGRATA